MSKSRFARHTSIVASLFAASLCLVACGAAVEEGDEDFDAEIAQTEDGEVGESEEALKFQVPTTSSGGTSDPTNGCGWFCPWWAKDMSDCIIRVCNNNSSGGVYAP